MLAAVTCVAFAACSSSAKPLGGDPFVHAFHVVRPSVVLFTMKIPSDDPKKKGQWDDAYGSGIVVASGAWGTQILTVEHVIHGARELRATLQEKVVVPVRIIGIDVKRDLALVEASTPDVPVAILGTARGIEPGRRDLGVCRPCLERSQGHARTGSLDHPRRKRRPRFRRGERRRHRPRRVALRTRESDRVRDPNRRRRAFPKGQTAQIGRAALEWDNLKEASSSGGQGLRIMSADREWKKWHLTPNGWVEGARGSYGNTLTEGSPPADRLLMCEYEESQSSVFSKVHRSVTEEWRCGDHDAIESALAKHGPCPQRM